MQWVENHVRTLSRNPERKACVWSAVTYIYIYGNDSKTHPYTYTPMKKLKVHSPTITRADSIHTFFVVFCSRPQGCRLFHQMVAEVPPEPRLVPPPPPPRPQAGLHCQGDDSPSSPVRGGRPGKTTGWPPSRSRLWCVYTVYTVSKHVSTCKNT